MPKWVFLTNGISISFWPGVTKLWFYAFRMSLACKYLMCQLQLSGKQGKGIGNAEKCMKSKCARGAEIWIRTSLNQWLTSRNQKVLVNLLEHCTLTNQVSPIRYFVSLLIPVPPLKWQNGEEFPECGHLTLSIMELVLATYCACSFRFLIFTVLL